MTEVRASACYNVTLRGSRVSCYEDYYLMLYDAVYISGKFKDVCEEFVNVNLQAI